MSIDAKKKKKESILLSLEKLNNNLTMAKSEGNTRQCRAIEKCIQRLENDLKKLKEI
jgi:hypothetical protein